MIWECQQAIPERAELSRPCFAVLGVTPGSPLVECNFTCISEPQLVETRMSLIGRWQPISPSTPERSLRPFVTIDGRLGPNRTGRSIIALDRRRARHVRSHDLWSMVSDPRSMVVAGKALFPRAPTLHERAAITREKAALHSWRTRERDWGGLALGSTLAAAANTSSNLPSWVIA